MKILVVDDEFMVREFMNDVLTTAGHSVSSIDDGHNALSLLADPKHRFDLLFLDIGLPRLSGNNLMHVLDQLRDDTRICIITGNIDSVEPKVLSRTCCILQKPFTVNDVLNCIDAK